MELYEKFIFKNHVKAWNGMIIDIFRHARTHAHTHTHTHTYTTFRSASRIGKNENNTVQNFGTLNLTDLMQLIQ